MSWLVTLGIGSVIVASVAALLATIRRRHWNVAHEDDRRREDP